MNSIQHLLGVRCGGMRYKKQSNAVYCCEYHIILPTKYRRKIFNEGVFAYMRERLREIGEYYPEIEIKEANHDGDHIHLYVSIPPKMSVGSVVRIIKANTARRLKRKFAFLKEVYWGTEAIWSEGYFVTTVGVKKETIEKYIQMQGQEDVGQAKLDLQ